MLRLRNIPRLNGWFTNCWRPSRGIVPHVICCVTMNAVTTVNQTTLSCGIHDKSIVTPCAPSRQRIGSRQESSAQSEVKTKEARGLKGKTLMAKYKCFGYRCSCGEKVTALRLPSGQQINNPLMEIVVHCKNGHGRKIKIEQIGELESWEETQPSLSSSIINMLALFRSLIDRTRKGV